MAFINLPDFRWANEMELETGQGDFGQGSTRTEPTHKAKKKNRKKNKHNTRYLFPLSAAVAHSLTRVYVASPFDRNSDANNNR